MANNYSVDRLKKMAISPEWTADYTTGNIYVYNTPQSVLGALASYKKSPDSYTAENSVFQELYKNNPGLAADVAAKNTNGYNDLHSAVNQAYGKTSVGNILDLAGINRGSKGISVPFRNMMSTATGENMNKTLIDKFMSDPKNISKLSRLQSQGQNNNQGQNNPQGVAQKNMGTWGDTWGTSPKVGGGIAIMMKDE